MSVPVLTFFNNKGGVGKTSLIYHLAWMLSDMGYRVVAVDLDPQANLTSAFLTEDCLNGLWNPDTEPTTGTTIYQCVRPLTEVGDILPPITQQISQHLHLVAGDLGLASFEDMLSREWPNALDSGSRVRSFKVLTAFWQVAQIAASQHNAQIVLADVGPNLGAINRSALIATDFVAIPLAADLFSLQGLKNLGPTLTQWREDWGKRLQNGSSQKMELPKGAMNAIGYVLMQHSERLTRPAKAYKNWADRIPGTYQKLIAPERIDSADAHCLARLKHYRSLMPMAQEVRKPIFHLTHADGAIGNHSQAVQDAKADFGALARAIMRRIDCSV